VGCISEFWQGIRLALFVLSVSQQERAAASWIKIRGNPYYCFGSNGEEGAVMLSKIRKKSSAYWKHGKHQSTLVIAVMRNKDKPAKPGQRWYASVRELMEKETVRRK
jgi:hypothetical protein